MNSFSRHFAGGSKKQIIFLASIAEKAIGLLSSQKETSLKITNQMLCLREQQLRKVAEIRTLVVFYVS